MKVGDYVLIHKWSTTEEHVFCKIINKSNTVSSNWPFTATNADGVEGILSGDDDPYGVTNYGSFKKLFRLIL